MFRSLLMRLATLFRRRGLDAELDSELQAHLDELALRNVRRGMTPEEAGHQARREFGGLEQAKEAYREQRGLPLLEILLQDSRYALRNLRKSPGFAAVAVLTLALGIGANTAIFSVVNAVVLEPLPYADPGTLVTLWEKNDQRNIPQFQASPLNYLDWRSGNHAFEEMAATNPVEYTWTGNRPAERLAGADVSASFFSVLRVRPVAGRLFSSDEDRPGSPAVVIVSERFSKERLGGAPLGQSLLLDGIPRTVIGVVPEGFHYPEEDTQIWAPLVFDENALHSRGAHWVSVVARRKSEVSLGEARLEMNTIAARLAAAYPRSNTGWGVLVRPLQEDLTGDVRPALFLLMAAVGVVLLVACGNVSNLLLARATGREREMAVRAALGASRRRIFLQLLVETLLLSAAGSALALFLAYSVTRILPQLEVPGLPRQAEIGLSAPVFGFLVLLAFLTAALAGSAPAWKLSRTDLQKSLKERETISGGSHRIRNLLVVSQIALSLLLLASSGLLARSFGHLLDVDPGFRSDHILSFRVELPATRYPEPRNRGLFFRELLERVRALPGVDSAGGALFLPLSGVYYSISFYPEGHQPPPGADETSTQYRVATPGYFKTMGIPLLRGRDFDARDREGAQRVAVINEASARQFFANRDPIGQRIVIGDRTKEAREIVGVVGSVRQVSLGSAPLPEIYVAEEQKSEEALSIVVHTLEPPAALVPGVKEAVRSLDKDLPVFAVRTIDESIRRSVRDRRFATLLVAAFALLALSLAAIGIYGVLSHIVAQGRREIGVRMALGARAWQILSEILRHGMALALAGVLIGLLAAFGLTRLLASLLFEISPTDPLTFAAVSALLLAIAFAACLVPALAATRVDPLTALREE